MPRLLLLVAVCVLTVQPAHAAKDCEELKTEIAAKIDANGVKGYTLEIVPNDKVGDAKVVGSCEGGTKKITYARQYDGSVSHKTEPTLATKSESPVDRRGAAMANERIEDATLHARINFRSDISVAY